MKIVNALVTVAGGILGIVWVAAMIRTVMEHG